MTERGAVIIIEGIQGAGKTLLCNSYAKWVNGVVLEEWVDESYLAKYIKNMKRYATEFQFRAQTETVKNLEKAVKLAKRGRTVFLDRGIYGNCCFAKVQFDLGYISVADMTEYEQKFSYENIFTSESGFQTDYTVETWLVDCNPKTALKRITQRDRKGEEEYSLNYLVDLKEYHNKIVKADKIINTDISYELTSDGCLPEQIDNRNIVTIY